MKLASIVKNSVRKTDDLSKAIMDQGSTPKGNEKIWLPKSRREAHAAAKLLFNDKEHGREAKGKSRASRRNRALGTGSNLFSGQELRQALLVTLKRLSAIERDFIFIELTRWSNQQSPALFSFWLSPPKCHGQHANKSSAFAVVSYYYQRLALRYEPDVIQKFDDLGWFVARKRVETPGHAVELLFDQLVRMGWSLPAQTKATGARKMEVFQR